MTVEGTRGREEIVGRRLIALVAVGVTAAPALALAGGSGTVLTATLSGRAERPQGPLSGRGAATIRVNGAKVCWTLKVSGTDKPLSAHIHKGAPGAAGPVVIPLGRTYTTSGCVTVASAVASALVKNPGAYYVNVHTKKYPAGAVRGQLKGRKAANSGYGSGDSSGGYGGYGGYGDYGDTSP